jgi:hypothetical protein
MGEFLAPPSSHELDGWIPCRCALTWTGWVNSLVLCPHMNWMGEFLDAALSNELDGWIPCLCDLTWTGWVNFLVLCPQMNWMGEFLGALPSHELDGWIPWCFALRWTGWVNSLVLCPHMNWMGEFLGAALSNEPTLSALVYRLVWSIGGMIIDGGKCSDRRETFPSAPCLPVILHRLTWNWTRPLRWDTED